MFFHEITSPSLWDSRRQMNILQDRMNRLFSEIPEVKQSEFPPLNVWASDEKIVVVAEIPGIHPENIDLQIVNSTLTLKTTHEQTQLEEGQSWHRQERGFGSFTRTLELPYPVDSEKVTASSKNGTLRIELERAAVDLPKKISIQAS